MTRHRSWSVSVLSFLLSIFIWSNPVIAEETTVIRGASILTVDRNFAEAKALAIRGNRILAVGDETAVLKAAGTQYREIDHSGKVILPAFIDAHTHPVVGSATNVFENVGIDRFRTIDDVLSRMTEAGRGANDSDWLLFINADLATQSFGKQKITTEDLDKVSSVAPVVLWHAGGHLMTVNSKMLQLLGVTKKTPNPPGSEYGRFSDGTPDGNIAGGNAIFPTLSKVVPYAKFDRFTGTIELGRKWLSLGMATLGVAGVISPSDWDVYQKLASRKNFPLRTRIYLQYNSLKAWDAAGVRPGQGDERVRVIGYKISTDGSNQAFTGLQREPYLGRDTRGLPYMMQSQIDEAVIEMSKRGAQMAMHGNGDAAIDNIIAAVKKARSAGVQVFRPRIEHCSIVQGDQLEKLKENEISCSFLIAHVLYWGAAFRDKVFGLAKAVKLDRTGSFERAEIPYSLHTDYAVSTLSPLEMIEVAVSRRLFSDPNYVLGKEEKASLEGAIRAVTSIPAWQLMSDQEIGSLEVGKLADFVVLDADPRKVNLREIGEIKVLQTWIDGRRVH